jgi:uncharacterized protein
MPKRRRALPPAVFDLLAGVDLVMHAGDVGELWVLDQLSRIAPVAAVHGNDEAPEALAALPFLTTLVLDGVRVVLTHGHNPDNEAEWAMRADPSWDGKLRSIAAHGLAHGASVVVYGHMHVPGVAQVDGVTLVNPGAISAAGIMRQTVPTVARMTLTDGPPQVEFFDALTGAAHQPPNAWHLPFEVSRSQYGELIFAPDLMAHTAWFRTHLLEPFGEEQVLGPLNERLYACWEENAPPLTLADVAACYRHARGMVPDAVLDVLWSNPAFAALRTE